ATRRCGAAVLRRVTSRDVLLRVGWCGSCRDVRGTESVLEIDEPRLFCDPVLIRIHTTRSSASFSWNFEPRRDPPRDSPTSWWYGTPEKKWWLFVGTSWPAAHS